MVLAITLLACGCDRRPSDLDGDSPAEAGADVAPTAVEGIDSTALAQLPPGATAAMVDDGRRLFPVCSVCHGPDGRGTQLGPPLRRPDWIHISGELEEIEQVIRVGIATPRNFPVPMPRLGGGDFDDDQIRALAIYVYALARSEP